MERRLRGDLLAESARTGRVVAQLIGGRDPEIPVAPFDPKRFL